VFYLISSAFAVDPAPSKNSSPAFTFADTKYFHCWTQGDQHEFTPDGQEDLEKWTDMVTIWTYPSVKDGETLAKTANTILEKYKAANGFVLRTASVPKNKDKPAEQFISVGFTRPEFREVFFARFKIHNGTGAAIIYSHRAYGQDAREKMRVWVALNGLTPEKNLMKWDEMPKLEEFKQSPVSR